MNFDILVESILNESLDSPAFNPSSSYVVAKPRNLLISIERYISSLPFQGDATRKYNVNKDLAAIQNDTNVKTHPGTNFQADVNAQIAQALYNQVYRMINSRTNNLNLGFVFNNLQTQRIPVRDVND